MNNLVKKESNEMASTQSQYSNLMQIAIESNADIDKLERLMELQERWESNEAKKGFVKAMAEFQSKCPMIVKKKQGHNCKYAPLGDIQMQVSDLLADCGLSYRFEQQSDGNMLSITCVVTHILGHDERVTMTAETDTSGKKNPIQARGSTVTYLQRYTFTGILGIITADEDTDGRLADAATDYITNEQSNEIDELIRNKGADRERLLKFFKVATIDDIKSTQFTRVVRMLNQKVAS